MDQSRGSASAPNIDDSEEGDENSDADENGDDGSENDDSEQDISNESNAEDDRSRPIRVQPSIEECSFHKGKKSKNDHNEVPHQKELMAR